MLTLHFADIIFQTQYLLDLSTFFRPSKLDGPKQDGSDVIPKFKARPLNKKVMLYDSFMYIIYLKFMQGDDKDVSF